MDSYVSVVIYDLNERIVHKTYDGITKAGYYKENWNGSDFSSGIYIVKMTSNGFTSSQKIMLIK